jgi:chromosome segregation ATPase
MANNIGRLVELGQEFARTGGGGLKAALGTLGKSILGTGGILIAIQLLISFLPTIQEKFKKWREGTKGVTEAQKELTKTLDDLIKRGEDNNKDLAKQEKLLNNAGDALTRLGHKYKEDSDRKGRAGAKQNEYNRSVNKAIAIFEQYGIQVDKARLKDDEYIKSLVGKGQTIDKLAKEIYALQTELEVGQILGAFDPVEQA